MTDRIQGPSLEELEREVPDAWVAGMWPGVRRELRERRRRRRRRWAVPALAAAALVLLFAQGLTLWELRRVEARSRVLTEQLLDQQRRLVELEDEGAARVRTGIAVPGREAWLRDARGAGEMTVADLRELLAELPAGAPLLDGARASRLVGSQVVPAPWRQALDRVDAGGTMTAGDVLELLDALDLADDAPVPTGRLIALLG